MRNERKKIPNTVSLPKYMLPDNNMMKAASKLKGDLKRMFPNSRPSKPEDVKKQFSKALIKQGKLRNYLKDGKTEVQPSLDKNRIINDILKNAHFDKDEKVEFEEVKNSTQKDRTKYKYFSKLMSKVDKIEFLKPKLTPFQKFRSISKGIYSLFKLYYSIKKLNNKLKSLKFDDLKVNRLFYT